MIKMGDAEIKKVYENLISEIKAFFKNNSLSKAVIGLSGGIDSAVCAKLVADAIGKANIKALLLPVKGLSSEENIQDGVEFCKLNGIGYSVVFINNFIGQFEKLDWTQKKIAKMNLASRLRAVILYNYANSNNSIVIGTSNKTEIFMGYFTKYGDGAADIEIIGDLFKCEVRQLARFLKISEKIINKAPTAELYPGQTDEKELGMSYDELDGILKLYIEEKIPSEDIIKKGFDKELVDSIINKIKSSEHKRSMPPILNAKGKR
jgi:NAD+ synthase